MTDKEKPRDYPVGYGKTPVSTRFPKNQSGNLSGRPRGRRNYPPYEAVLGQMVTIREDGAKRRVTAAEAFLLHLTKRGLEGDNAAARAAMAAIEEARAVRRIRASCTPRASRPLWAKWSFPYPKPRDRHWSAANPWTGRWPC